MIVSKLPKATRAAKEFENKSTELVELASLIKFLEARAYGLDPISENPAQTQQQANRTWRSRNMATEEMECVICHGSHKIFRCSEFLNLTPLERYEQLNGTNLCFNCLQAGHSSKVCRSQSCTRCVGNKKHNTLLCRG